MVLTWIDVVTCLYHEVAASSLPLTAWCLPNSCETEEWGLPLTDVGRVLRQHENNYVKIIEDIYLIFICKKKAHILSYISFFFRKPPISLMANEILWGSLFCFEIHLFCRLSINSLQQQLLKGVKHRWQYLRYINFYRL